MTDLDAFELGENIALTPGKVIFQNDLMQLIQYEPGTEQVYKRPLLIIPPWINKYYILDLRPKNSFIKYAVEQGFTVFVISWVNPDERHAEKTFEDYLLEGPLAALDAIEQATGERECNVIGYCLGGTLLACTLACLAVKRERRFAAASFFTALTDFDRPGELGVFIDEEQLAAMDEMMAKRGYLDGREMATTFNMLRANDLIAVRNAQLLPAQVLPGEQADRAWRHHPVRCADRPAQDPSAGLHAVDARGPHRAVGHHLCRYSIVPRQDQVRPGRIGTHRRRGQSADPAEVRLLDQRPAAARPQGLAGRRHRASGLVVAGLGRLERGQVGA
jgi:hypothetical protein